MFTLLTFLLTTLLCASAMAEQSPIVELGDTLIFEEAELKKETNFREVEWSQSMRTRKETYLQLTTMRQGEAPILVMIFVHKALAPALAKECDKGMCTLKVTKALQYGQNKEKTVRFLVWHDKGFAPYQHRFLSTNTLTAFSDGAEALAKTAKASGLPVPGLDQAGSMGETLVSGLKSIVGDPLREF